MCSARGLASVRSEDVSATRGKEVARFWSNGDGDARPDMMQSCIAQQHIATTKGGETRGVRHAWCTGDRRSEAVVKGNQSKRGKKWRRAAAVVGGVLSH
ncbi:hypothetical protein B0H12DRAFT_219404 [Mycena haematopus]|nr:hypothetical protein B0H12DRAFT_219404 [Mycena haematopus]